MRPVSQTVRKTGLPRSALAAQDCNPLHATNPCSLSNDQTGSVSPRLPRGSSPQPILMESTGPERGFIRFSWDALGRVSTRRLRMGLYRAMRGPRNRFFRGDGLPRCPAVSPSRAVHPPCQGALENWRGPCTGARAAPAPSEPNQNKPVSSLATYDIISGFHGGSKTRSTWAAETAEMSSIRLRTSSAMT